MDYKNKKLTMSVAFIKKKEPSNSHKLELTDCFEFEELFNKLLFIRSCNFSKKKQNLKNDKKNLISKLVLFFFLF
jgi:hypothetical protein